MNDDYSFLKTTERIDFSVIDKKVDPGIRWNSISLLYIAMVQIIMMIILNRFFTPEEFSIIGLILIVFGFGRVCSDVEVSGAVKYYQIFYPENSKPH